MGKQMQQWFRMEGPVWDEFLAIAAKEGMDKSTALRYAVQEYVIQHGKTGS